MLRRTPPLSKEASPQTYVKAGMPPFYIFYGDLDTTVPPSQNTAFYNALIAVGCDAQITVMTGQGHGVQVAPVPAEINTFLDTKFF